MFFSVKVKILWALVLLLYAQSSQVKSVTIDLDDYTDELLKGIQQQLNTFQDNYDNKNVQDQYGSKELSDINNKLTVLLGFRQTYKPSDKIKKQPCKCENFYEDIQRALSPFADQLTKEFQTQFKELPKKSDFCTFGNKLTKHLAGELKTQVKAQNEQLISSSTEIVRTSTEIKNKLDNYNETFTTSQNEQTKLLKSGLPNSCSAAIRSGNGAGAYQILISNKATSVYCDQHGRMMIQHQMKGFDGFFNLEWSQYKSGFGDPKSQYWLGLENVHLLTTSRRYELHIDMVDFDNITTQFIYNHFQIAGENDMYRLNKLGEFSGNPNENKFGYHINLPFSTRDRENYPFPGHEACAIEFKSGWWYYHCHMVNLNINVRTDKNEDENNILRWGNSKALKEASMYIKVH